MEERSTFENFEMQLNETAKSFIKEIAKWAYFLSIVGYVGVGLLVLVALFFGSVIAGAGAMSGGGMGALGAMGGTFVTVLYLIIALIYFFPIYYLNKFASNAKQAFRTDDTESLTKSFEYLKSHYKFMGIFTIVFISFYVLIFVFAMIGAASSIF